MAHLSLWPASRGCLKFDVLGNKWYLDYLLGGVKDKRERPSTCVRAGTLDKFFYLERKGSSDEIALSKAVRRAVKREENKKTKTYVGRN